MLYIFDMGGVVTTTAKIFSDVADQLGITKEQFKEYCGSDDGMDLFEAASKGFVNAREFWEEFSRRSGMNVNTDWFHFLFHPENIPGTRELVAALKSQGHRVVCGTNTMDSHYHNHLERGDYAIFDQTYASHFMGVMKPEPAFWEIIMKAEKVTPDQVVFFDDREENVRAAEALGIKSILFVSAEQAAREAGIDI